MNDDPSHHHAKQNLSSSVMIVGGGLAGSEAAWQIANAGISVDLYEMRPKTTTAAHQTDYLAELVCSNSFRSDDASNNAVGLLHHELRAGQSLIMKCADQHALPAGGALAVDRDGFARTVTDKIKCHPKINLIHREVYTLPHSSTRPVLIATGPLTGSALAQSISQALGDQGLAFFDAIAPIVYKDSIDFNHAWLQSRYDKPGPHGTGADYINCALDLAEYDTFIDALLQGEKTNFKDWEINTPYFEGCLPIEIMAERGKNTLRFGPMKPVGLTDPKTGKKPFAVVQLRQDNSLGTLYNMVGFQTKLKHGVQKSIFRLIPALRQAEFARLGGLHRNTFIRSPIHLDQQLRLKNHPMIRMAGQMTGVEGYVESTAMGWLAAQFIIAELGHRPITPPPPTTAIGALHQHITQYANPETFQPMNVNFGLFLPIDGSFSKKRKNKPDKNEIDHALSRKQALSRRAMHDWQVWINQNETGATVPR